MFTSFAYTPMTHCYETNQYLRPQYIKKLMRLEVNYLIIATHIMLMSYTKLSPYCGFYQIYPH